MTAPIIVVGAGLAGAKAVEAARESGYDGRLLLVGAEPHAPYERPPLSKDYLLGSAELDSAFVHDPGWYDDQEVELRVGTAVSGIEPGEHRIRLGAEVESYSRLLLTTGCTPRRMPLAERDGAPVTYLRTIEDSIQIKQSLGSARRVVIIGGGWIGLEVASAARAAGVEVTVIESLALPLLRVLGPEVAEVFASLHRDHGVDLRVSATVDAVERSGDGAVVRLGDGSAVTADLLVVGVGVLPNTELAETSGLAVDNGILVDELLRSSDPDVFAAGDVASIAHPVLGRRVRVEHWDNAIGQGTVAGQNLAGRDVAYDRLPYFFSDQYDLGMEYVGYVGPDGYDSVVVRGDAGGPSRTFTAFWLSGGTVLAGMHANDWDAIDPIRELVGHPVDPAKLQDPGVSLGDLATSVP
jgi:3-phenylpropionate/trans-cinnamate dioxygenase ferredoxin reductase component